MKIKVICVGDELLNGQTLNSNLLALGSVLSASGYSLAESQTLPDDCRVIESALARMAVEESFVVVIGGLGPTTDDLSREAVANFMERALIVNEDVSAALRKEMARRGREVDPGWLVRSSEWIEGADLLPNKVGLAPGLYLSGKGLKVVMLPGPPREFGPMLTDQLLPLLEKNIPTDRALLQKRIFGITESRVEASMQPILEQWPVLHAAYCAKLGSVRLTLSVPIGESSCLPKAEKAVGELFAEKVLETGAVETDVANILIQRNLTIATVESCTGGMIAATLTELPGSSNYFMGSYVTYQNEWKARDVGVSEEILQSCGAVSEECAHAMVAGLVERTGVDTGIAVTGIAGPGGGSAEKPVGLVYVATAFDGNVEVGEFHFRGGRADVRQQTKDFALNQLRLQIIKNS